MPDLICREPERKWPSVELANIPHCGLTSSFHGTGPAHVPKNLVVCIDKRDKILLEEQEGVVPVLAGAVLIDDSMMDVIDAKRVVRLALDLFQSEAHWM